jgi:hypothetical protein
MYVYGERCGQTTTRRYACMYVRVYEACAAINVRNTTPAWDRRWCPHRLHLHLMDWGFAQASTW